MDHQLMTQQQQSESQPHRPSGAQWVVGQRKALRLEIGPGPREILATRGQLWLTRAGTLALPAEDVCLEAGECLAVVSGSEWVVEAVSEGGAEFQLLVPPSACARMARQVSASGVSLWRRVSAWVLSPARFLPAWFLPARG